MLELSKYPHVYFLREQLPLFQQILEKVEPMFEDISGETFSESVEPCTTFASIRIEKPGKSKYYKLPLLQFIMPSLKSKFRELTRSSLAEKNASLIDFYCCMNGMQEERRILQTIKKRLCHYDKAKVREYGELEKKFKTKSRFFDTYNDLLVFRAPSLDVLVTFVFAVLDYNRRAYAEAEEVLLVYFEKPMRRVAAALKIQTVFKNFLLRSRFNRRTIVY